VEAREVAMVEGVKVAVRVEEAMPAAMVVEEMEAAMEVAVMGEVEMVEERVGRVTGAGLEVEAMVLVRVAVTRAAARVVSRPRAPGAR